MSRKIMIKRRIGWNESIRRMYTISEQKFEIIHWYYIDSLFKLVLIALKFAFGIRYNFNRNGLIYSPLGNYGATRDSLI